MKILVAEDNEDGRHLLTRMLEARGYSVEAATNGAEALEMAKRSPPDMIVSDILMPKTDGFELCRLIKEDEELKQIPFVFYTATYIEPKDRSLAMALGAVRFVVKPVANAELLQIIEDAIGERIEAQPPASKPTRPDGKTLGLMHAERLAEKLDKKVRELEEEHRALQKTEAKLQLRTRRLEVLNSLLKLSLEDMTLEAQLGRALDEILSVGWMPLSRRGGIFLVEDESEVLVLKCQKNLPAALQTTCARVSFGRCLCGRAATDGRAVYSECLDHRHENRYDGIAPHGHYCMPIVSRKKVLGVIVLYVSDGHRYSSEEEAFLESAANTLAGIIERKQVEIAWRESEAQVRRLLDSTGEGIYGLDLDAKCTLANSACVNLLGYRDASEIVGREMHTLVHHSRPDGSPFPVSECQTCRAFLMGRAIHADDEVFWRADGTSFPVDYRSHPVLRRGEIVGAVVVFFDISERKRAEEDRSNLETQLRQAQKMEAIGQLAGGIAHDFNNILASILGYTGLAVERFAGDGKGKLAEYLNEVYQAGERARDLVDQLLAFGRRVPGRPIALSMQPAVMKTVKMLRSMFPSTFDITTKMELDPLRVHLDPVQLQQLIMNLCINARDAMDGSGRICVAVHSVIGVCDTCAACGETLCGDFVELSVEDSGSGVEPAIAGRMFDPFFTTKPAGKGTGMGLPIVQNVMHQAGGHVLMDTECGLGTTFRLLFPKAAESTFLRVGESTQEEMEPVSAKCDVTDARILVVDDESSVARCLGELLERRGYRVDVLTDSRSALASFRGRPEEIDLVITDQTMPGLTGWALAKEMLTIRPDLPIILCTGYGEQTSDNEIDDIGIQAFFQKPVETGALLARVQELLSEGEQPPLS